MSGVWTLLCRCHVFVVLVVKAFGLVQGPTRACGRLSKSGPWYGVSRHTPWTVSSCASVGEMRCNATSPVGSGRWWVRWLMWPNPLIT